MQILDVAMSGILPRNPHLRIMSVESGIGWMPFVREALDHGFEYTNVRAEKPEFTTEPSEYLREQVWACAFFEAFAPQKLVDVIGADPACVEDAGSAGGAYRVQANGNNLRVVREVGLGREDGESMADRERADQHVDRRRRHPLGTAGVEIAGGLFMVCRVCGHVIEGGKPFTQALEIAGVADAGENFLPDDARKSGASVGYEGLPLLHLLAFRTVELGGLPAQGKGPDRRIDQDAHRRFRRRAAL